MKALSIRQPWAWLIVHGGKNVENRTWHTKHRGRFAIHASQGLTKLEYHAARDFALERGVEVPAFADLQRGGIVGTAFLADSRDTSLSPWYMGEKAFLLIEPKPVPFIALKGRLGFFEIPDELVTP